MKFLQILITYVLIYMPWCIYMGLIPRFLHIMQMEGYKFQDYARWLGKNLKNAFKPNLFQLVVTGGYAIFLLVLNLTLRYFAPQYITHWLMFAEYAGMWFVFFTANLKQILTDRKALKNAKKKLVYTARAKRLWFWNLALLALVFVSYVSYNPEYDLFPGGIFEYYMEELRFFTIMTAIMPFNMAIANFLAYPTELAVNDRYKSKARRLLNSKKYKHLIKIGITGSYGKTSTKYILKTILSEKFSVYATPESYNTAMGNVRVILNELKPEHEVFISEMGARYKGDIDEICYFVEPQYAMITSIGPQHLESFGTVDKIAKTKAEILDSLPLGGVAFLPRDNGYCQQLYSKEKHEKYCYTIDNSNADVYAKNVVVDENGSTFVAHTSIGEIKCVTKLLGEHNVLNILGCIAIAVKLGLTVEEIERGVRKIEPIEHRLQILDSGNGTIVIDDAFNSNPVGAKMALDVLAKFKGRKIVVTPGMVELGAREESENKQFGRNMARVADVVILVGIKRSKPIAEGLKAGKFDDMNVHVVADLDEATKLLAEITRKGDVVLFENDLPDSYNE